MKFYNHLLAYTLVALATLCSQPLSAQLRLSKVITDTDTTHYIYDAKGQITKMVSGGFEFLVEHRAKEIHVTPLDSLIRKLIIYNDPKTHLTTSLHTHLLFTEEDTVDMQDLLEVEAIDDVENDSLPFLYDSKGRLIHFGTEEFPEDSVVFKNNRLFSCGKLCQSLSYSDTPLPAEAQACIKAIPNFSIWLFFSDTRLLSCFFPLARLGASLDGAPTSGKAVRCELPYDELNIPDQDSPVNPFIDLVDARSPRLMDIEAVRPSMQVEQAVSEDQEREEQWLTLQQYDDFMAYVEQINAAYEDMPDMEASPKIVKRINVRFTYTLTTTAEGQRALRVDFTPEDTTKLRPTDIVFHKTITFVFE